MKELQELYKFRVSKINTHDVSDKYNEVFYVLEIFYDNKWSQVNKRMANTLLIELDEKKITISKANLSLALDNIYKELRKNHELVK